MFLPFQALSHCWLAAAPLGLELLKLAGPTAYLLLAIINLEEIIVSLRAKRPCSRNVMKALAHAALFLKLLLL
jgi:hypothetical protein